MTDAEKKARQEKQKKEQEKREQQEKARKRAIAQNNINELNSKIDRCVRVIQNLQGIKHNLEPCVNNWRNDVNNARSHPIVSEIRVRRVNEGNIANKMAHEFPSSVNHMNNLSNNNVVGNVHTIDREINHINSYINQFRSQINKWARDL